MTKPSVKSIVAETEQFVKKLLNERLTEDHRYHNLPHTLAVRQACLEIARRLDLPEEELEILELACLLHDTGFVEVYEGHEAASHRIAKDFLHDQGYPKDKGKRVLQCIDATFPPNRPADLLDKIIRDADLANLGSSNYPEALSALRHEWDVFLGQKFNDRDWYRLNADFLQKQRFHTAPAEEMFEAGKQINEKYLKRMAKQHKEKKEKKKDKELKADKDPSTIQGNRSAQMMFKTALRNHLDLSSLADNKANIMLSITSLILTVAVPMVIKYISDINSPNRAFLYIPLGLLLITCLISMVFATLATRPINMTGYTDQEKIDKGQANLFFFGNFYAMNFDAYSSGMQTVIGDPDKLESAIRRDLYFLGRSLGKKYKQLRICYNIFMVGMVATMIVLAIMYMMGYMSFSTTSPGLPQ